MNRENIVRVLHQLGATREDIGAFARDEVPVRCVLARWTHGSKGGKDNRPSMSVRINPLGPSPVKCFGCGFGSTSMEGLVQAVQMHDHERDFRALILDVIRAEQVDFSRVIAAMPRFEVPEEPPPPEAFPDDALTPFLRKGARFTVERGVLQETWRRWQVGYDEPRGRVIFPLRDLQGRLVGVTGRTISDRIPKYLNYTWVQPKPDAPWQLRSGMPDPEKEPQARIARFPKSKHLLGEHLFPHEGVAVLVEGPFDTVLVDQALRAAGLERFYGVLGFLGSKLTEEQAQTVVDIASEVLVFTDNDEAGKMASVGGRDAYGKPHRGAVDLLRGRVPTTVVEYPPGTLGFDPGTWVTKSPETLLDALIPRAKP